MIKMIQKLELAPTTGVEPGPVGESQSTYTKPNLEAAVRQPLVRMREFRNIRNPENKNTRQEWREGGKEKIKN